MRKFLIASALVVSGSAFANANGGWNVGQGPWIPDYEFTQAELNELERLYQDLEEAQGDQDQVDAIQAQIDLIIEAADNRAIW